MEFQGGEGVASLGKIRMTGELKVQASPPGVIHSDGR